MKSNRLCDFMVIPEPIKTFEVTVSKDGKLNFKGSVPSGMGNTRLIGDSAIAITGKTYRLHVGPDIESARAERIEGEISYDITEAEYLDLLVILSRASIDCRRETYVDIEVPKKEIEVPKKGFLGRYFGSRTK